ncbi:MAG TPA: response regulator [Candidatus Saccharibacteria bacterium]|nr:response regulator [Candidatus Saccharibacteria bacterium]HMT39498.1 response regulator [Candidatus Saccharibacteria bacterium]
MKKTILLIENDKILRDMYATKLKKYKYQVVVRAEARSALEWLSKNSVDLIVLDILLPKINGIKLIKNIRKDHHHKSVKIIILTHLNQADINLNTTIRDSLGVDGYFVKSQIAPDKLIDIVRTIIE